MTSGKASSDPLDAMRKTALIAVLVGAVGSVVLTVYAGRHNINTPTMLLVLFAGWVLSPFVALALALLASTRWAAFTRAVLNVSGCGYAGFVGCVCTRQLGLVEAEDRRVRLGAACVMARDRRSTVSGCSGVAAARAVLMHS